jgi:hypothetical protein
MAAVAGVRDVRHAVAGRDLAMSQRPTASADERSSRRQSGCHIGYSYR